MLNIEYEVLVFLRNNPNCKWYEAINAFDPQSQCNITDGILECLYRAKMIQSSDASVSPDSPIRLTPEGLRATLAHEQATREKAQQERQHRQEYFMTVFATLAGAVIGALITLAGACLTAVG